ncbi:MAG: GGDEF domain-containing protein [Lachnospiraceae bacterium]|nr:GGDEF domain-containing protein [Lachnospiraceae bacterium]
MRQNDSYATLVNDFMSRLEDVMKQVPEENELVLRNLHEIREMANKISFRADSIDVYSLNYFFKCIDEAIEAGCIDDYAACRFDLKRFSVINHQFGREIGTKILNEFIVKLQKGLGKDGCVCRIHGDTFTMLFRRKKLSFVMGYLSGTMIEVGYKQKKRAMLSAHAGYYEIQEGKIPEEIMDRIGMAWNIAKHVRRVPYVFFDENLLKAVENEKWVESIFEEALEKEEFLVYYQPKVTLKNYRLTGAEALCRWKHDGEMIMPFRFIPVLEQSNMICDLDFYILEHVCRDISRWIKAGIPVVRVSVNLSRVHLGDVDLLQHVLEIVDQYEVPHEYIELELTETTTDVDFRELKHIVTGLRMQGFSVAVDDFGVGYSSLNLIREMPWKVLKIDKSFLPEGNEDDADEEQKKVMLKHIIGMAQNLGLECIAEGVETVEQVTLLKENNCYLAQGYLFDKPLPVEQFEERLGEMG